MPALKKRNLWILACTFLVSMFTFVTLLRYTNFVVEYPCPQLIDARLTATNLAELQTRVPEDCIDHSFYFNRKSKSSVTNADIWTWFSIFNEYRFTNHAGNAWFTQFWRFSTVRIEDVIRCLGQPDSYLSVSESNIDLKLYTLSLIYEHEGFIATAQYFYAKDPAPPIDASTPLFFIDILAPGTSQKMIEQRYAFEPDKLLRLLSSIRDWPGKLENVEVPTVEIDRFEQ